MTATFLKKSYLFLVALGPCCCIQAFSSCSKLVSLFIELCRPLIAVGSLVVEHRIWGTWASVVAEQGLRSWGSRAPEHRLNGTHWYSMVPNGTQPKSLCGMWDDPGSEIESVSCISRWILIHYATRETQQHFFKAMISSWAWIAWPPNNFTYFVLQLPLLVDINMYVQIYQMLRLSDATPSLPWRVVHFFQPSLTSRYIFSGLEWQPSDLLFGLNNLFPDSGGLDLFLPKLLSEFLPCDL